ncbi:sigma-70 family RNA polymerase sigma factor [Flagellimonas algicola]|uniref:Sigma-70 family RNA polymerase sigma factor n=1 Tax=Flagellimonas algicola TaxID=2583815 RepID=A0ABY2WGT5_9FLAO|nr:sigma-70 family RNA polymerase sigma factor [Allomuricauda algicola]TMU50599.1 sigma-70 family RNA polymerase sigma factor [Allomuricauda algicola]
MEDYQNKLFPYAYNILGSADDAKDAIQEILIKYQDVKNQAVQNEMGYLVRSVINESINLKKKRQMGLSNALWLPEPIATDATDEQIDSSAIISYSMMVLLEKLSPKERAVFILKEAFGYSHQEIGLVLEMTLENSRKLLSRGRSRLRSLKKGVSIDHAKVPKAYLERYVDSIRSGDIKNLEQMLSEDIMVSADGGDEIQVVRELTRGLKAAVKLLLYVFKTYQQKNKIVVTEVNHQPALLYYQDGVLVNCQIFQIEDGKIVQIHAQLASNKLKALKSAINP